MAISVFLFCSSAYGKTIATGLKDVPIAKIIGVCGPRVSTSIRERVARLIEHEKILTTRERRPHPNRLGFRYFPHTDIDAVLSYLRDQRPAVILCCGFPKLIPSSLLETATRAINIHPGLLPERAGGTPVRWAIRLGDSRYGLTAHYMTDKFDSGDIIFREELQLPPGATAGEAEDILTGAIQRTACTIVRASYGGAQLPRTPQQSVNLLPSLRGKHQFVDWLMDDAESIRRLCLAMRPKSGALTKHGNRTLVLWHVEPAGKAPNAFRAGTVCNIDPEGPRIATTDGSIVVHEALIGGKVRSGRYLDLNVGDKLA